MEDLISVLYTGFFCLACKLRISVLSVMVNNTIRTDDSDIVELKLFRIKSLNTLNETSGNGAFSDVADANGK
ncbi:hypothetical protein BDZ94DRAFT_1270670 [Collybia nuda]|uniref:Uncharacterized protein n=1 Tax=Collybia nuda TaxID=64659 RepID=A0A9P5XZ82_9AGAR|nr:hypothetical protein BDZ94DRAFT_1270670 [Collybia nuda]